MIINDKKLLMLSLACSVLLLAPIWSIKGIFWDGWIYDTLLKLGEKGPIYSAFGANGRPGHAIIISFFDIFDEPNRSSTVLMCLLCAVSAFFFFKTLHTVIGISAGHALSASLLGLLNPAYLTFFSISMAPFGVSLLLFWLGLYITASSLQIKSRVNKILFSFLGCVALTLSAVGEATIFLFPLLSLVYYLKNVREGFSVKLSIIKSLKETWWIYFLAGLIIAVILFAFPVSGNYTGDRGGGFRWFLKLLASPIFFIIVIFALSALPLFSLILSYKILGANYFRKLSYETQSLFMIGFIGLTMAVLPYIITGRLPAISGYQARFLLFAALPLGACWAGIVIVSIDAGKRLGFGKYANLLPYTFIVWGLAITSIQSHFWHVRWLRDSAILQTAASLPSDVGLVIINDANEMPFGEELRPYEWQALILQATDRKNLIATSQKEVKSIHLDPNKILMSWNDAQWAEGLYSRPFGGGCKIIELNSSIIFSSMPWNVKKRIESLAILTRNCSI